MVEAMEHLHHLVAQAVAVAVADLCQEILELVEDKHLKVDLVEVDSQEQFMFTQEFQILIQFLQAQIL
jgi:peptide subunit release factor 1 (eRF1)